MKKVKIKNRNITNRKIKKTQNQNPIKQTNNSKGVIFNMTTKKKTAPIPKVIDDAFDNMNDLMRAMTTEGQKDLGIHEDKGDKLSLTSFGCVIDLKNRNGKGFSVLVTDTDDIDVFRKRILDAAKGIQENFPHLMDVA